MLRKVLTFLFHFQDRLQQGEAARQGVEKPSDAGRRRPQTTLNFVHPTLPKGVLRRVPARGLQQPHVHRQGGVWLQIKHWLVATLATTYS